MITDKFCIFFNNKTAAASDNSSVVSVSPWAGRDDPVNVTVVVSGANAAAVSLAVKVQQSEDGTTFHDVASFNVSKPDALGAVGVFALPYALKDRKIRLAYTLTGTATGLTVWAGITREHFAPYEKGLYIDKGKVAA